MKSIFDQAKRNAYQAIKNSSDNELRSADYAVKVEKAYLPEGLEITGEKEVNPVKDIPFEVYVQESGKGGIMSPGMYQKVEMFMSVKGSEEIFNFLAKNHQLPMTNEFQAFNNGKLRGMLYNGYSRQITGNSSVLAELKKDSDEKFAGMKERFKSVNDEIKTFADRELRPLITKTIADEIKQRDDNNNARQALR